MSLIQRAIRVDFALRVYFTEHVFDPANLVLKDVLAEASAGNGRALVVVDRTLDAARPDLAGLIQNYFKSNANTVELVCSPVLIEGGECSKTSDAGVVAIHRQVEAHHIDRQSYIVAVGGGAMLDVAGFAAATAHRGIRLVRMPTTTLSQADSGVGVKNGINAFGKKNFIGTFTPPYAVINDFQLLSSLPDRDKRTGYVEAVKVALIRDAAFFEEIERVADALRQFEPDAMRRLIRRCAELHLDHIAGAGDPFEFGTARPLDFGHWSAHKLEQLTDYRLRHGEAVAVGIALDVVYSRRIGRLDATSANRALGLLERLGFDLFAEELSPANAPASTRVLEGLEEFREHLGGELTVTLLAGIGRGFESHEVDPAIVLESIAELKQRHQRHPQPA